MFSSTLGGFTLTTEEPCHDRLRFLDVELTLHPDHVCWKYCPRSKKNLLPFTSAHSKIVKRGIATSALRNALIRSCSHQMGVSFSAQAERLTRAGFPEHLLFNVCETLLKEIRNQNPAKERQEIDRKKLTVIPYVHGVSHRLKKAAARAGVTAVFSAPNKLSGLCARVNGEGTGTKVCLKNHAQRFVECSSGVVYDIPLSCGKSYTGQTGRCLNDRLREHANTVKNKTGSNLALHCAECADRKCTPLFEQTRVLKKYKGKSAREIYEAHVIHKRGDSSVSKASIELLEKEHRYLDQ